jgi:hypothetical protein
MFKIQVHTGFKVVGDRGVTESRMKGKKRIERAQQYT